MGGAVRIPQSHEQITNHPSRLCWRVLYRGVLVVAAAMWHSHTVARIDRGGTPQRPDPEARSTLLTLRSAIDYDRLIRRDHRGVIRLHPLVHLGSVQASGE